MRIIFMGTPEFAVTALDAIKNSRHQIAAVVTTPDKERGRGRNVTFTPVKEYAVKNNIPVLQPEKLKDTIFLNELAILNADLFVVVAFRILPKEVYSLPPKGTFNLHGSILPKYRGAAPIQWSLINGDKETGVTTFFLEDKVDTGNIILCEKLEIADDDNFGSLHDKMAVLGSEVILKTIEMIEKNEYAVQQQDSALATGAPKITKETCLIDWTKPAIDIHNLIRGLAPYPGAFFTHKNKIIKIFKSAINTEAKLKPGEFYQTKNSLTVGCGSAALDIIEIQQEGKKVLSIDTFLRGYSFK